MPEPDQGVLGRRRAVVEALERIVGCDRVVSGGQELLAYESDGLSAFAQRPLAAVLPEATEEVAEILRWCHANAVKVVPRGAGTSLSGGALPLADGIVLSMMRFNRILEIDYANRVAVVQPGVTNLAVTRAVEGRGFFYAPDPSSQVACSIGGNVAENSGGVHCLKYGLTTHNVTGLELVLMDGEVIRLGGRCPEAEGLDLLGLVIGSEGLLGVVTEATVRILPKPEVARAALLAFGSVEEAGECVARIIGAGITPAGLEMMDRAAVEAAEAFVKAGYPTDCEALLILEVDGLAEECDELLELATDIARGAGARRIRLAATEAERSAFWAGRKAAFPAVGRISPDYYCVDGTIPRRELPNVLRSIYRMAAAYRLRVANVFHAGDGNLHPLILYDGDVEGELERAEELGAEILKLCVAVGGVLTGEHGVGVEKRDLMPEMFSDIDLAHQQRVKCAFDPDLLLNPGKMFPVLHRCAELGRLHVRGGRLPYPDLPRF